MRAYKASETSKDGFVNLKEFTDLLYFLKFYDTLASKFESIDGDGNGKLAFEEFKQGHKLAGITLNDQDNDQLQREFDAMDVNGGGVILFDEFCMYMARKFGASTKERTEIASNNAASYEPKVHKPKAQQEKKQDDLKIDQVTSKSLHVDENWSKEQIHDMFLKFDATNNNGLLSLAEIDKYIQHAWPEMFKNKKAIMRAYKASDKSQDGFINAKEFEELLYFLFYYDKLHKIFDSIDTNDDQRVSFDEFKKALAALGIPKSSEQELKEEFARMDTNGGGYALFDEFCVYLAKKFGASSKDRSEIAAKNTVSYEPTIKKKTQTQTKAIEKGKTEKDVKKSSLNGTFWTDEQVHELFQRFDATNKNGLLSLAEIDKAARDLWPEVFKHKKALMRAYKSADKSGDGFIGEPEFKDLLLFIQFYDQLYLEFAAMDADGDSRIQFEEFKKGCKIVGLKNMTEDKLKAEFAQIDVNGGGMILFDEFCSYLVKRNKEGSKPKEATAKSTATDKKKSSSQSSLEKTKVAAKVTKPLVAVRKSVSNAAPAQKAEATKEEKKPSVREQLLGLKKSAPPAKQPAPSAVQKQAPAPAQQPPAEPNQSPKPASRARNIGSAGSNATVSALERKLNHEQTERKRLEGVVATLKHQLEQFNPNTDHLTKNYLSGMDQLADKNFKLQQKLEKEQQKNTELQATIAELSQKLKNVETSSRKEYIEKTKHAKDQQLNALTKEVRDLRDDKVKMERLCNDLAKKLATEEDKNKKMQDELFQVKQTEKRGSVSARSAR